MKAHTFTPELITSFAMMVKRDMRLLWFRPEAILERMTSCDTRIFMDVYKWIDERSFLTAFIVICKPHRLKS